MEEKKILETIMHRLDVIGFNIAEMKKRIGNVEELTRENFDYLMNNIDAFMKHITDQDDEFVIIKK
jgi:cob(I)alamin adenosyltransferase